MSKFVSRGNSSSISGFSFCFSAGGAVIGNNVREYVRSLEFGHYVGLSKAVFSPDAVFDVVMTHDDSQAVMSMDTRYRSKDVDTVLQAWKNLERAVADAGVDQTSDICYFFAFAEGSETKILCYNMECSDIQDEAERVCVATCHELPCISYLLETPITQSCSWNDKLFAWNCLPNINVTGRKKNSSARVCSLWQATSLRSLIEDAIHFDAIAVEECADRILAWLPPVLTKTPRSRSKASAVQTTAVRLRGFDLEQSMSCSGVDDDGLIPYSYTSAAGVSVLATLKAKLVRDGIFRVLRNDDECVQVVWNAYDSKTGEYCRRKFVTTTLKYIHNQEPLFVCEGCPSFQHCGEITDQAQAFCLHTKLLKMLTPQLSSDCFLSSKDPFVRWAVKCSKTTSSVVKLDDDRGLVKFFVQVSDGAARLELAKPTSICFVWLSTSGNRLSCDSAVCLGKTMKQVKQTSSLSDLCCHLRAVFEHSDYKDLWQFGVYASSYSVCGPKDIALAFEVNAGENLTGNIHGLYAVFTGILHGMYGATTRVVLGCFARMILAVMFIFARFSDGLDLNADGDGSAATSDFYVKLNPTTDEWEPNCESPMMEVPLEPDERVIEWSRRRLRLLDVEFRGDSTTPLITPDGFMIGKTCVPQARYECEKCGGTRFKQVEATTLTLRTYCGAVRRKVVDVHCEECLHVYKWDPSSECILTIRNGREGGEY